MSESVLKPKQLTGLLRQPNQSQSHQQHVACFVFAVAQVGEIRRVLKQDMRLIVKEVGDAKATLDGGDVLFTGLSFLGCVMIVKQSETTE